jgi:hypothetical protein
MYLVKAIRKDTNEWIEGYLWKGSSYAGVIPHNLGVCVENNKIEATMYEVYDNTICRAVGAESFWQDKKGAHVMPIYENDIVQYRDNGALYEGCITNRYGAYVIYDAEYAKIVYLETLKELTCDFINVQIVGNKYDEIIKALKTPAVTKKDEPEEECPYYEKRETSYDVMSGHSDYQEYCTKKYDKKIVKCVHCTLCKQNGENK